ncbi:kinase-like domain-containing protein [Hypoxylon rubiginosum]|uniref:Kinase-like domain-containing protein n=1 Tax=Hypoxylon rubiginosum TaxID=110542 RepID=A0ACC0D5N5_9PEZI|nr:kinase-like domain-containing protein [Hypoxylon rubiginosum]
MSFAACLTLSTPLLSLLLERLERYVPGGYHPVHIGDQFHNRYRVLHKLGHGSYSTTWLARDQKTEKLVAVKVGTADSNPREADILSELSPTNEPTTSAFGQFDISFPPILDRFKIQGTNGLHPCYVTLPARASLSDAREASLKRLFQLNVARALAAQLALSVAFLHSKGLVHGDLHLGNVLLRAPTAFQDLPDQELYDEYGQPQAEPVTRVDGKRLPPGVPSYGLSGIWLGECSEKITLQEAKIWVSDLGEAFRPSIENRYESITPVSGRPPEFLFKSGNQVSFSSDIWTLACSIWNILSQRPLFDDCFFPDEDDIMCQQIDFLGLSGLPNSWWDKWERRSKYFTETGEPSHGREVLSWEYIFEEDIQKARGNEGYPQVSPAEKEAIFAMIRPMLTFKPEDRCTAAQVLQSKWMTEWALPEYQKIK